MIDATYCKSRFQGSCSSDSHLELLLQRRVRDWRSRILYRRFWPPSFTYKPDNACRPRWDGLLFEQQTKARHSDPPSPTVIPAYCAIQYGVAAYPHHKSDPGMRNGHVSIAFDIWRVMLPQRSTWLRLNMKCGAEASRSRPGSRSHHSHKQST